MTLTFEVPLRKVLRLGGTNPFTQLIRHGSYVQPDAGFINRLYLQVMDIARRDLLSLPFDRLYVDHPDGPIVVAVDMRNNQFIAADQSLFVYPDGYELDVMAAMDLCVGDDDGFIDAGANWGYFSLHMALRPGYRGTVQAFEPARRSLRDLRMLVHASGLSDRIAIHDCALFDAEGEMTLNDPPWSGHVTLLGGGGGERVRVTTLDACGLPPAALLKSDVEGAEAALFRGGAAYLKRSAPHVVFECRLDTPGGDWAAQFTVLRDLGYSTFAMAAEAADAGASGQRIIRLSMTPMTAADRPGMPEHLNVFATHDIGALQARANLLSQRT